MLLLLVVTGSVFSQKHPCLMLTPERVQNIRAQLGTAPLFDAILAETMVEVDAEIAAGIDVPVPRDMAGGYTHERHKRNFFILQKAGVLYQITTDKKYAVYVRDMLLAYAKLYPTLGLHPTNRSYATGKIFWQCLNDANWLVYVSQAYDCVYDFLKPLERTLLEQDLFRPLADFLSVGNPQFFNRIHNHSTWGNAAVGMIGLVMQDKELVDRALYGLKTDNIAEGQKDNDGGFIKQPGQIRAGFLAQLDGSFSPDGYFTEGPYYLRYAIYPFLLFSKALANNRPALDIFGYRDGILKKAVYALLYQTDAQGQFFPINDAQKGMSWLAREVVTAVDLAYFNCGRDPALLSIAALQGTVLLDEAGFTVARDLAKNLGQPFHQKPMEFVDGPDGKQGGVGILRSPYGNNGELCLVLKYSAQGMGHGHFDKLSYALYDETAEVVQDYGAARWVNIDQKGGGRYLRENDTWAKQTIAHNTLVVNEQSNYGGDVETGERFHPDRYFFNTENNAAQAVSAKDQHAYPGTRMHRTMLLLRDSIFEKPLVLDIFRVNSETENQYDLPTWFQGHLLAQNFDYQAQTTTRAPLGTANGYQHLWLEAEGKSPDGNVQITWFGSGRFFTQTTLVAPDDDLIFARLGANDPNFNLRPDPVFIQRKKGLKNAVFVSVIEPHGLYTPVAEIPQNPFPHLTALKLLFESAAYTAVQFTTKNGALWTVLLANENAAESAAHEVVAAGKTYRWTGPFTVLKN
ncbi:MAG: alginate lyase family protein [Saprospiraceae bacterium]|nr:alginate lyase family protein [Saprospiraceae bacterium]